ncbi:hypothetical protein HY994_01560 [Candidatus Micrarchaeota archaeon]|nr:hypothetical protein [Candidatus Micrarchaeota archaeon]
MPVKHVRKFLNLSALETLGVLFAFFALIWLFDAATLHGLILKSWKEFDNFYWPGIFLLGMFLGIVTLFKLRKEFGGGEYTEVIRHRRW